MNNNRVELFIRCLLVLLPIILFIEPAFAGGGAMPWDKGLQKFQDALTGTPAKVIAVISLAVAGGMLAFGGELSEFAKRICMVIIAASVMIGANSMVTNLQIGQ